jgi:hypothetical protein
MKFSPFFVSTYWPLLGPVAVAIRDRPVGPSGRAVAFHPGSSSALGSEGSARASLRRGDIGMHSPAMRGYGCARDDLAKSSELWRLPKEGGTKLDLLLIILVLVLLFGGGFGYSRYGYRGGIGIGGVLLIVLIIYLLLGRGRF